MGRTVKGWGESNNTPGIEHRALLVRVWGICCGTRKAGELKEWIKETKAKRHTEGRSVDCREFKRIIRRNMECWQG